MATAIVQIEDEYGTSGLVAQCKDDIKAISYSFAKYLGEYQTGQRTYRRCPKDARCAKAYKRFMRIGDWLCFRLIELETNTYGKGMYNKLVRLGDYIMEKFMVTFGIESLYNGARTRLALYLKK